MHDRGYMFRIWNGKRMAGPLPLGSSRLKYIRQTDEVMQFTAVQDDYSKDVYEGDVVDWQVEVGPEGPYEVRWGLAAFVLKAAAEDAPEWPLGTAINAGRLVVMGNVFEQPDLMGGGNA
jgi:hypothetical protein